MDKADKAEIAAAKQKILIKNLLRYDSGVAARDVLSPEVVNKKKSGKTNSLVLQALILIACKQHEPDEQKRKLLFRKMWKFISKIIYENDKPVLEDDSLWVVTEKAALTFEAELKRKNIEISQEIVSGLFNENFTLNLDDQVLSESGSDKYEQEFNQISILGEGGFGKVYKAQHKIDSIYYAVKRIKFKYKNDPDYLKVIREVKTFSTLHHINVVRYNQCWLSYRDQKISGANSVDSSWSSHVTEASFEEESNSQVDYYSENETALTVKEKTLKRNYELKSRESDISIVFQDDSANPSDVSKHPFSGQYCVDISSSSHVADVDYSQHLNITSSNSSSSKYESSVQNLSALRNYVYNKEIIVELYIQMEYCDHVLKTWLTERAEGKPLPFELSVFEIFRDILNGVNYIHSKSIIHRDLKPLNIYYSVNDKAMKIGDFGLATLSDAILETNAEPTQYHSSRCGTLPYAAPEQRSKNNYDCKVDMYSLGVILLELILNAKTSMELLRTVSNIIAGDIPKKLKKDWPEYMYWVEKLLSKDHTKRPSAKDILSRPPFTEDKSSKHLEEIFKREVTEKDKRINELTERIDELTDRINEINEANKEKDDRINELTKENKELADTIKMLLQKDSEKGKCLKELEARLYEATKNSKQKNRKNRKS